MKAARVALFGSADVANERATVAAPPSSRGARTSARPTDLPSSRPTSLPAPTEEIVLAQLRRDSVTHIPLDLAVPRRAQGAQDLLGLSHRAVFLLLHVDDVSTLQQIAYGTGIPQHEVVETFLELLGCGAVELGRGAPMDDLFESGIHETIPRRGRR